MEDNYFLENIGLEMGAWEFNMSIGEVNREYILQLSKQLE